MKSERFFDGEDVGTIKAYNYGNTIVVKYYDSGEMSSLACPHCHWFGELTVALRAGEAGNSEFCCPDCKTKLASVTIELRN